MVNTLADTNKRYYWLKLPEDFFRQKEIKQLRKIAGGDVFTIVYLKMLLRSLKDDGRLYYDGIEENFASELALDIDEEEENVKITVAFLLSKGLLIQNKPDEYELLAAGSMMGSEGFSAERMRRLRQKALLASHCDAPVTLSDADVRVSDEEIEKEIDKEKIEREEKSIFGAPRFTPPTVDEVRAYAQEKGWKSWEIDPEYFVNFYASKGWKVGKNPMKDWRAAASGWVARERKNNPARQEPNYDAEYDPWLGVKL